MHQALGSRGVITDGTVRDLDEVERLGFHFFASGVQVSHGYAHLEDFNQPVTVFGMKVCPGDLIHADKHGAVVIPHEIAREVAKAAQQFELNEKPILAASNLRTPSTASTAWLRRNTSGTDGLESAGNSTRARHRG